MSNIKCCQPCKPPERFPGCGDYCITYKIEKQRQKQSAENRMKETEINQYQRDIITSNRAKAYK